MAAPGQNGYILFLLAAKFMCAPGVIKAKQNDMPYLCRRGLSGPQKAVFAFIPSVRRGVMKKNVKSSIFRKKTSKFLSSLPFKV